MEKRILLAFVLSIAVMSGYQFLFSPKRPMTPPPVVGESTSSPAPAAPPQPASAAPQTGRTAAPLENSKDSIQSDKIEDIVVETPLYLATLSNHGAILKSLKLKEYKDATGEAIELIDADSAAKLGWPLSDITTDAKLTETLATANFAVKRDGDQVSFDFAAGGVRARKVITFAADKYEMDVVSNLSSDGKATPHDVIWGGRFGDQAIPPDPTHRQVVHLSGTVYTKTAAASLKEPQTITTDQVGVEDQYFLAMFLLPQNAPIKIVRQESPGADGKPVPSPQIAVPAPEGAQAVRVYAGPKQATWLAKTDPRLVGVVDVDYGWFGFIVKPLTLALLWVHSYIGNFGWSIIVLTVVINLVLFPLRLKQQVSMQRMQQVQPQMRTLQDKYKKLKPNDPKRVEVQSQMMGLYKEHGINPMSGCLPLLLQMPFLIAFWRMLSAAIELRQAPWILWITDLSRYDPYYVLPILMAVTMLITQKMTPSTGDPVQARMMMIMPIMFTFLFLKAQAGLALYMLASNVVGIAQTFFINKYWPAAATARKNSGRKTERAG